MMNGTFRYGVLTLAVLAAWVLYTEARMAHATAGQPPSFEAYPAASDYPAKSAALRTESHPRASRFRSALSRALKDGSRFGGRYALASWGCGTACQAHAIVDLRTGDAYFPKEIESTAPTHPCDRELIEVRRDSRLISITWIRDGVAAVTTYYEWAAPRVVSIVERSRPVEEFCAGR